MRDTEKRKKKKGSHIHTCRKPSMKTRETIEDIMPFMHPDVLAQVSSLYLHTYQHSSSHTNHDPGRYKLPPYPTTLLYSIHIYNIHTYICTYISTYIPTYIPTYIHIYIHAYMLCIYLSSIRERSILQEVLSWHIPCCTVHMYIEYVYTIIHDSL